MMVATPVAAAATNISRRVGVPLLSDMACSSAVLGSVMPHQDRPKAAARRLHDGVDGTLVSLEGRLESGLAALNRYQGIMRVRTVTGAFLRKEFVNAHSARPDFLFRPANRR